MPMSIIHQSTNQQNQNQIHFILKYCILTVTQIQTNLPSLQNVYIFFISCIFSAKFSSLVTLTLLFKSRRKRRNASRHHFYSMSTSVHLHTTFNGNTTLFYFASCDNKNLYFCVFVDLS